MFGHSNTSIKNLKDLVLDFDNYFDDDDCEKIKTIDHNKPFVFIVPHAKMKDVIGLLQLATNELKLTGLFVETHNMYYARNNSVFSIQNFHTHSYIVICRIENIISKCSIELCRNFFYLFQEIKQSNLSHKHQLSSDKSFQTQNDNQKEGIKI